MVSGSLRVWLGNSVPGAVLDVRGLRLGEAEGMWPGQVRGILGELALLEALDSGCWLSSRVPPTFASEESA